MFYIVYNQKTRSIIIANSVNYNKKTRYQLKRLLFLLNIQIFEIFFSTNLFIL